jgi:hypothetical protein
MATTEFQPKIDLAPIADASVERPFGVTDEELSQLKEEAQVALFIKAHMEQGTIFERALDYMTKLAEASHIERAAAIAANRELTNIPREAERKAYIENVDGGIKPMLTASGEAYLQESIDALRNSHPHPLSNAIGEKAISSS